MPGLDGIRAVAVLAVIAYHLNFGWASGGLLGVGMFFTLSGYLITDLLLGQWDEQRLKLGDFWVRRARRLLPALFVMLIVVSLWVAVADRSRLTDLRGSVWSAVLYINNWWQISQNMSYFARFAPPSPLSHLWSLAVEEQFYLIWPWLLLLGLKVVPERRRPMKVKIRPRLAGATLVLAAASAVEMVILYHPSFDATRIYDGTDTRAFGLLFGAALAMVWPSRGLTKNIVPRARTILDAAGIVGLLTVFLLIRHTNQYSPFLYHGGIVLLSVGTVLLVASCAHPASRVGVALGWAPLRWIGVRSYGIYLWHEPIIVLTTPATAHTTNLLRALLQLAATCVIAALSWRYVEEPIRHGALRRLWLQARTVRWQPRMLPRAARTSLAAAVVLLVLTSLALAGVKPPAISSSSSGSGGSADLSANAGAVGSGGSSGGALGTASRGSGGPSGGRHHGRGKGKGSGSSSDPPNKTPLKTSCKSVVHIGDSTSEGLTSPDYLPDAKQRIPAQYARVGATTQHMEITGATSIVETLPGGLNAQKVAHELVQNGYKGCWVIALGTNDTADVYVGSSVSLNERVKEMMAVIGTQRVLWVNAKSLLSNGPYSESDMEKWNDALYAACPSHPNMHVYDWASVAKDSWFIPDGIHYYSDGYAARAHLIANALAKSFPAHGDPPRGCVVHTNSIDIKVHKA
jgi:peptidoglycan/LPS O-acetylase OafA/YrhL